MNGHRLVQGDAGVLIPDNHADREDTQAFPRSACTGRNCVRSHTPGSSTYRNDCRAGTGTAS